MIEKNIQNISSGKIGYYRRFQTINDLLQHLQDNITEYHKSGDAIQRAIDFYKKELSHICGWHASSEDYDQRLYDKTMGRIFGLLRI